MLAHVVAEKNGVTVRAANAMADMRINNIHVCILSAEIVRSALDIV